MRQKFIQYFVSLLLMLGFANGLLAQNCISGTVYEDLNNDGFQDVGENGLIGHSIALTWPDGSITNEMTDIDGVYGFCSLATGGAYTLEITSLIAGTISNPNIHTFDYTEGDNLEPFNFALLNLSDFGQVRAWLFVDGNRNGDLDPDEYVIEGDGLILSGNGLDMTVKTDPYGISLFENIPAGSYDLSYGSGLDPNTLLANGGIESFEIMGGQIVDRFFAIQPIVGFGTIHDYICYDLDANGLNDPLIEPGIYRHRVDLINPDGTLGGTTFSDASGRYAFTGITAGEGYLVRINYIPEDLLATTPVEYPVIVDAIDPVRPGPFYGQPLRKIFSCGMAISTFGSDKSNGYALTVKDIRDRTGVPISSGSDWPTNQDYSLAHPNWKKDKLGEKFGIAADEELNIYLTATQIPTYIGSYVINNQEAIIHYIEPYTGAHYPLCYASPLATAVGGTDIFNAQTGIGNICSNEAGILYFTNMSDGTIVAIGDANHATPGQVLQVYTVTSFAPSSMANERVWGIGYNKTEQRVYFSGPTGAGNVQIYSIDASAGLLFGIETPEATANSNPIADIAFTNDGINMLVAERAHPHYSEALQYSGSTGSWGISTQVYVGAHGDGSNSAGGVDYGYESFSGPVPVSDNCETIIAASGNALNYVPGMRIYGYALFPIAGNIAPIGSGIPLSFTNINSILVDNDNDGGDDYDKRYVGDVEIFDCPCAIETPPTCAESHGLEIFPASPLEPAGVGDCCHSLDYTSTGQFDVYGISLNLQDGVEFQPGYQIAPGLIRPNHTNSSMTITDASLGIMPTGINGLINFCLQNITGTPQFMAVDYLDENFEVMCTDTLIFECPLQAECLEYVLDSLVCDTLGYKYTVDFIVPPGNEFPNGIGYIKFNLDSPLPAGSFVEPIGAFADPSESGHVFPTPLQPGDQVSLMYIVNTPVDLYGDSLCVIITAHDDIEERLCCFAYEACIPYPLCDPCPYVSSGVIPLEEIQLEYCCFELIVTDTFALDASAFTNIEATICTPGVTFDGLTTLPAILNGWTPTYDNVLAPTTINWSHSSGVVPNNLVDYNLFDFCVEGTTSTDSIEIKINWLNADSVVCSDTLSVYCPNCLTVVNDSLSCNIDSQNNPNYVYQFSFVNHSPFNVNAVRILDNAAAPGVVGNPGVYMLGTTVPPGGTYTGSIPVQLNPITGLPDEEVCFDIVLRQIIGDDINITCCYATHCVILEDCEELPDLRCPDPTQIDNQVCDQIFDPICSCDGITYANICYAQNAGITNWTDGPCELPFGEGDGVVLGAQLADGGVQLGWNVGLLTYDFYVVRGRWPGETAFKDIAIVPTAQTSIFSFLHLNSMPGLNDYQVLGITASGLIAPSNIVQVLLPEAFGLTTVYAYPNPASNEVYVTANRNGHAILELVGTQGQIYHSEQAEFNGTPHAVNIDQLAEGVFIVRLKFDDGEMAKRRLVKIR